MHSHFGSIFFEHPVQVRITDYYFIWTIQFVTFCQLAYGVNLVRLADHSGGK